uniref:Uncharacterized protein n=1 Tax=Panagrolaimus sp. PS1159 TaxID=55785 RepID=A0AC35FBF4_9BILA
MSMKNIELLRDEGDNILSKEYDLGHRSMTYKKFCEDIKNASGLEVIKLANDAKYRCGKDFLASIGFIFDENNDLAIIPIDVDNATDIELLKDEGDNILSKEYDLGHRSMTYEKFCQEIKNASGLEVVKLANDAQYRCGKEFLASIGFIFNKNKDLAIIPIDGDYATAPLPPPKAVNHGPPVHLFDGDVGKLAPGMSVKISNGTIYVLPKVSQISQQDERSLKLQGRALAKYQKKVNHMVQAHNTYKELIAKMYGKKTASA